VSTEPFCLPPVYTSSFCSSIGCVVIECKCVVIKLCCYFTVRSDIAGIVVGSGSRPRDGRHIWVWTAGPQGGRSRGGRPLAATLPQGDIHTVAWCTTGRRSEWSHLSADCSCCPRQRVQTQISTWRTLHCLNCGKWSGEGRENSEGVDGEDVRSGSGLGLGVPFSLSSRLERPGTL